MRRSSWLPVLALLLVAVPTRAATPAYEWKDYTKPIQSRIQASEEAPGKIQFSLPAAVINKPAHLTVSTSVFGPGAWATNARASMAINGRHHSSLPIGPEARIHIEPGRLRPGVNVLAFSCSSRAYIEVYDIRIEIDGLTAPQPETANPPPPAPKPAETAEAVSPKKAAEAPRAPEPPIPAKQEPPAVAKKEARPPWPEAPASARQAVPAQPAETIQDPGQRWAVIVGVSSYEDSRIPSLRYAARDAQVFHDWLVSPSGGRFAPSKVKLLLDREATNERIKDALFNWLKQAIEEDVVVIYFAGHGSPESPDAPQNLYLLPYNARYDNIAVTGFPMWDIETALKRFIKAKRVVIIADACHAAGVGEAFDVAVRANRGLKINQINAGLQNLTDIGEGVCVISASRDNEYSQEGREWGGGHGVFSHFLIEGLQGAADFDRSNSVSIGELTVYVSQQVRRATRNAQNPIVAGRFDPSLVLGK
jgi:hypothetical protein